MTAICLALWSLTGAAQINMPDPKQISGVPLPASDVPSGSLSVRVIRGSFSNNVSGQPVEFTVDGKTQTIKDFDDSGRALISGLAPEAHLTATTVLDGQRLVSQNITIGSTGIRIVLVGVDPEAEKRAAEDARLASGPAAKGLVVLGPETRVIVQLTEDRLDIFYMLQILNSGRTPVDIGGPFVVNLPAEARGAALMDPSPRQAAVSGARLIVTGPFPPGPTVVNVAFGLPGLFRRQRPARPALAGGPRAAPRRSSRRRAASTWPRRRSAPAAWPPIRASRCSSRRVRECSANTTLSLDISGLPHHAVWPRYLARHARWPHSRHGLLGRRLSESPRARTAWT